MDSFYLAILLFVTAIVIAFVDLFVPSGGLLLVMAALSGFASVLFGFRDGYVTGMSMLTLVVGSIPVFVVATIKIWPYTLVGRRVILPPPRAESEGSTSPQDYLKSLLGMVMVADSHMLPTGHVKIGHRRFNAVAESNIVEAGQRIKVVAVRENNLIVRVTSEAVTPKDDLLAAIQTANISSKQRVKQPEATPTITGPSSTNDELQRQSTTDHNLAGVEFASPEERPSHNEPALRDLEPQERSLLDVPAEELGLDSLDDEPPPELISPPN